MRVCPAGSPVKVHAPVCVSGFQHPALAVAPERYIGVTQVPADRHPSKREGASA